MSSTQDNQSEKRKATRDVLLDRIAKEAEAIDEADHQVNRVAVLKSLAEAYALVYHGSRVEPPKVG